MLEHFGTIVATAVGTSTIVTFLGTRLWDAYRMEKKYVTLDTCVICKEERKERMTNRTKFENDLNKTLALITNRLKLGNLIMSELCEKADIPKEKIEAFEKALDVKLREGVT